ncbi:hypothetical protein F2P56_032215 [Juglans regia]|uniref:LOB domain-containing protein n=2 Tax=Juglans regia TaxID=51240 RepID=A0A833TC62_JUGRE|nr:LOB domain-containing protein 15-like [Juglans regia]KAF5446600.1 hypothetical protein F2P56_032215 [Juglans regia]
MSTERERFYDIGKKIKRETDASSQMGRRHLFGPSGTLNTLTPCAACKLLRRRCAEECPFSPYFSPHEPQKFAAVHRVFGASNVSKMLMEVPESQRADTANSLVYEANLRLRDPVYGCMGAISALQQQIQTLQAELNAVRAEMLQHKFSNFIPSSPAALVSSGAAPVSISHAPPHTTLSRPPSPPPPPPNPPVLPPLPSAVTSFSSSSSTSLYTPPSSATGYSSIILNANIQYFD